MGIKGRKNQAGKSPLNDNDEEIGGGIATDEGGRGASQDSVQVGSGGFGSDNHGGYSFFGDASGHNKDTYFEPQVKPHSVSSLGNDKLRKGVR